MRYNRYITQLEKLIDILNHRGAILKGARARAYCLEDANKDHHEISYKAGEFTYFSASESPHNGDYYDQYRKVLPVSFGLIQECINTLTEPAIEQIKREIKQQAEATLRRKAIAALKRKIQ